MHLAAQRTNTLNRKRACTECARARERCSRDEPCMRCSTKSLQCLYPDDAGRGTQSLSNETLPSSGNDHGHIEEQSPATSRNFSLLPKNESSMPSSSLSRESFNEGDASFREFLYALRSQTSSSYLLNNSSHSSNLLDPSSSSTDSLRYKISRERQPPSASSSSIALGASAGNEPRSSSGGGFVEPGLETGRQAPMFEQPPGASFTRPHDHDMIDLDDPRFGQALGEYSNLCPTTAGADPPSPFDFQMVPDADAAAAAAAASAASSSESAAAAATGSSRRPPSLSSNFRSPPINLKAYELIASNFKELCLEYGSGAAPAGSSHNISESQRTAQHELLVKLYYEHFKQNAY